MASSDEDPLTGARRAALRELAGHKVLIKYGGNAMTDSALVDGVLAQVVELQRAGLCVVLVHGGGPYIQQMLDALGLKSEFIGGHRRTGGETIRYVGMVLCGQVNGEIVGRLNKLGARAVGLSGRDAGLAMVVPRRTAGDASAADEQTDLGFVGDIDRIDPRLVLDLLDLGYLPVVAPISTGPGGADYNVNADMFAGHLAAGAEVDDYIVLTDVDGLCRDRSDSGSLIDELLLAEIEPLLGTVIAGGMIPKVESCAVAVAGGVPAARIVNGTAPDCLRAALLGERRGTLIKEH